VSRHSMRCTVLDDLDSLLDACTRQLSVCCRGKRLSTRTVSRRWAELKLRERRATCPSVRTKSDTSSAFCRPSFEDGYHCQSRRAGAAGHSEYRGRAQGEPISRRASARTSFARSLEVLFIKDAHTEQFSVHVAIADDAWLGSPEGRHPVSGRPSRLPSCRTNDSAVQRRRAAPSAASAG